MDLQEHSRILFIFFIDTFISSTSCSRNSAGPQPYSCTSLNFDRPHKKKLHKALNPKPKRRVVVLRFEGEAAMPTAYGSWLSVFLQLTPNGSKSCIGAFIIIIIIIVVIIIIVIIIIVIIITIIIMIIGIIIIIMGFGAFAAESK